mgnify:CR=1 FL=1
MDDLVLQNFANFLLLSWKFFWCGLFPLLAIGSNCRFSFTFCGPGKQWNIIEFWPAFCNWCPTKGSVFLWQWLCSQGFYLFCLLHAPLLLRVSSYRLFLCQQVRKPYTITKQRERWSEEEHKKFLDALKLYGRAWRRIEGMIQYFNLHFLYSQANSLTMIHFLTLFGFYNRTRGNKKCSSD